MFSTKLNLKGKLMLNTEKSVALIAKWRTGADPSVDRPYAVYWADDLATITTARSEYSETVRHHELMGAIQVVGAGANWGGSSSSFSNMPTIGDLLEDIAPFRGVDFDQVVDETDVLGLHFRKEDEVQRARSASFNQKSQLRTAKQDADRTFSSVTRRSASQPSTPEQRAAAEALGKHFSDTQAAVEKYRVMAITKALYEQAVEQSRYEKFTRYSIAFFPVGLSD